MAERSLGYIDSEILRLQQARRLIEVGVHTHLGLEQEEYVESLPRLGSSIGQGGVPILVEARLSLPDLMRMGRVHYNGDKGILRDPIRDTYWICVKGSEFSGFLAESKYTYSGYREVNMREAVSIAIQRADKESLYINMHQDGEARYYLKSTGRGVSTIRREEYLTHAYCS